MWPTSTADAPSSWGTTFAAQALALAPCGRVVRDKRRSASRSTALATRRPEIDRPAADRGSVTGTACVFETYMTPETDMFEAGATVRVMYAAGAFDRALREIGRDRHHVELCLDHDPDTATATTRDGSLRLSIVGDELRFEVRPTTPRGRRAIAAAKSKAGHRQASVGTRPVKWTEGRDESGCVFVTVTEARIEEISLVPRGACPGARCEVR